MFSFLSAKTVIHQPTPFLSQKRAVVVMFLSCLLWGISLPLVSAEVHHIANSQAFLNAKGAQTIFLEVQTSTWKTRGVMFWDVKGSLILKLTDAGFDVVRKETDPHALTLTVDYQEKKGQPFAINRFGTVIEGVFRVSHHTEGPLFEIQIQETSEPSVRGTPPYLDVLHNFLSNPYYHYLGELVRGEVRGSQDPHAIFIDSLHADVVKIQNAEEFDPVDSHAARPQHSMPLDKKQYAPVAVRRTIDELVQARDTRLVRILKTLLQYPDVYVQVRSVKAFGDFGATEAIPFLTNLSQQSQLVEVRSAAQNTVKLLGASSR